MHRYTLSEGTTDMRILVFLASLYLANCQKGTPLDEKIKSLQEWMYKRPIINMNVDRWKTYVRSSPRNYSMVVMFTALSAGVNCPICK
ncbi:unnamed protein product [Gongylonema pulchrum]|uniref:Dolichyl-diphosphooligosaccharide--protein glycosyltransferase subunit MAGT1 n=1 Tax=Gongylonema pulchrum TaxID=637853 RepID=A0A183E269_9BILA|nr:unnamed protein product [Gongylonema pulchrum]